MKKPVDKWEKVGYNSRAFCGRAEVKDEKSLKNLKKVLDKGFKP